MPSYPALSVVICTFRAPASIDILFDSLEQQRWQPADEIILVDNGVLPDRLPHVQARLEKLKADGVAVVFVQEPQPGLVHARRAAFRRITRELVMLLDDDNSLAPDALEKMRQRASQSSNLGGICPRIEPVWPAEVSNSVIALGHDVLSYNHSRLRPMTPQHQFWPAGTEGLRPPGGGMILRHEAVVAFVRLTDLYPEICRLGHRGTALGSSDDYWLYRMVYWLKMPTCCDAAIGVFHHIPVERTRLDYLLRLYYNANRGFAQTALMLLGKASFPLSIAHSVWRLGRRCLVALMDGGSFPAVLAMLAAECGYIRETFSSLFAKEIRRVRPSQVIFVEPGRNP